MGLIPEHIIEQVRQAHAIEEIVGRAVELKKAGSGFKGLCPFHEEKTPSFTVSPSRQTFKCFGCGKGGNVFSFLMETMGLNFPEALRMLAEERGIQVPRTTGQRDAGSKDRLKAIYEALAFAQRFFHHALSTPEGASARTYLLNRGYDADAIREYGLGFAPDGWDRLLEAARKKGIKPEILEAAGLAQPRSKGSGHYDRFRNRVIFPISDLQRRVVTFGARALSDEDNPKYLNGPETDVFRKSGVLYALDRAQQSMRNTRQALLMEGYTDVLMAHIHGFDTAVAGMGTALTSGQAAMLNRFASRVVLVYDSDAAGQAASERGIDILIAAGLEVRIASLPPKRDVDEILLEEGAPAFQAVIDSAQEIFDFKVEALRARFDLGTPRGRAEAIEALVPTLALVPSEIERDQLFRQVAEHLGGGTTTEAVLRRAVAKRLGTALPGRSAPRAAGPAARASRAPRPKGKDVVERTWLGTANRAELYALLGALDERFRDDVIRQVGPEDFKHPALRRLFEAVRDAYDRGRPLDLDGLHTRAADDQDALQALTVLDEHDEETSLEDAVTAHLKNLEERRGLARKADALRDLARQFGGAGQPNKTLEGAADGAEDPGKTPQSLPSHEQWPPAVEGAPPPDATADDEWNPESVGTVEDPTPPELEPDPYLDLPPEHRGPVGDE